MYYFLSIIFVIVIIIIIKTITFKNKDLSTTIEETKIKFDKMDTAKKLSTAISIKTISNSDYSKTNWDIFKEYHKIIEELFPLVHTKLEKELVNDYSLLYKWKGKDDIKKPIIMTAHYDVVPIEKGTADDWKYKPFSGAIEEGYVWGRGALDTKITMISVLEAAELLLKNNFIPEQDIYFAFGHDEEVGGMKGALKIVEVLENRGIEFDFLIDEGGCITENVISGINKPLALIGIAEKGYANIRVNVSGDGGHASMPPKHTSLGLIANVISNLENHQLKLRLTSPTREFLMKIGPEMSGINKVILANLWIFKPLFMKIFSNTKSGSALLRTTTAATMADGSMEPNVLPQMASATFNFRISPEETGEDLLNHIKKVNKKIPIDVEALRLEDPSMISSSKTNSFEIIEGITKLLYKDVIVSPYIVLAGTDARKYEPVCKNIYRFTPFKIRNEEMSKMHGTNENISIDNIEKCVEFYINLFEQYNR